MRVILKKQNSPNTINQGFSSMTLVDTTTRQLLSITPGDFGIEYSADWLRGSADPVVYDAWATWEEFEISFALSGNVEGERAALLRALLANTVVQLDDSCAEDTEARDRVYHLSGQDPLEWQGADMAVYTVRIRTGAPYFERTASASSASLTVPAHAQAIKAYRVRLAQPTVPEEGLVFVAGEERMTVMAASLVDLELNTFDGVVGARNGDQRVSVAYATDRGSFPEIAPGVDSIRFEDASGRPIAADGLELLYREHLYG